MSLILPNSRSQWSWRLPIGSLLLMFPPWFLVLIRRRVERKKPRRMSVTVLLVTVSAWWRRRRLTLLKKRWWWLKLATVPRRFPRSGVWAWGHWGAFRLLRIWRRPPLSLRAKLRRQIQIISGLRRSLELLITGRSRLPVELGPITC